MLVSQQGGPPAGELHPYAHHSMMLLDWPVSLEPARSICHSPLQKYHDPRVTHPRGLHSISHRPQPGWETPLKVFADTDARSDIGRAVCTNAPESSGGNRISGLDRKGDISHPAFPPFFSFFSFFH